MPDEKTPEESCWRLEGGIGAVRLGRGGGGIGTEAASMGRRRSCAGGRGGLGKRRPGLDTVSFAIHQGDTVSRPGLNGRVKTGSQWGVSGRGIDYNDNVPNLMPLVDIGMGFADLV